jgi:hypothetical protein
MTWYNGRSTVEALQLEFLLGLRNSIVLRHERYPHHEPTASTDEPTGSTGSTDKPAGSIDKGGQVWAACPAEVLRLFVLIWGPKERGNIEDPSTCQRFVEPQAMSLFRLPV